MASNLEYGQARIEFPDGSAIELDNVLLNAKGACVFELIAHADASDPFKVPVRSRNGYGREHNIPKEWIF